MGVNTELPSWVALNNIQKTNGLEKEGGAFIAEKSFQETNAEVLERSFCNPSVTSGI